LVLFRDSSWKFYLHFVEVYVEAEEIFTGRWNAVLEHNKRQTQLRVLDASAGEKACGHDEKGVGGQVHKDVEIPYSGACEQPEPSLAGPQVIQAVVSQILGGFTMPVHSEPVFEAASGRSRDEKGPVHHEA
jgi:hypothetical protein